MKKILMVFAMIAASVFVAQPASAVDQVCPDLSTGKINAGGTDATLTITAPEGFLIDSYCVKAGSAQQGEGPEIVQVDPPAASVVISHSSGKDISHYAAHYVKKTPPGGGDEPGDGDEPTGGVSPAGAEDDDLLPNTGGLPLWVLLLAGPMMAAGVVILKRRNGTVTRGGMHL